MLDFLFITSPTNARDYHPPYYYLYLMAYLEKHGLKCGIVDIKGKQSPELWKVCQETILRPSRFIGLSAFHSDYPTIMKLGAVIKFHQPKTPLLVGNVHATLNPEDFIYPGSPFDIAVIGEGEKTCLELAKRPCLNGILRNKRFIDGICYLDGEKRLYKTAPRHTIDITDLDPISSYSKIDMAYYTQPQKYTIRRLYTKIMPVFAGRGCDYNCSFCAANSVWKTCVGKRVRMRDSINVVHEINYLWVKYKIDFFYLFDDTFGRDKEWLWQWFRNYHRSGPRIPYAVQTRADVIDEAMVEGLKDTGCIQVDIGVETGSHTLLHAINKGITRAQIIDAFELCKKHKIRTYATMMVNLPMESKLDIELSEDLLKRIKPTAGTMFAITTPYPGTKMCKDHLKEPLKKEEYHLLANNRLDPTDRFQMASHNLDLDKLWNKLNRKYKANPMFERMWATRPFQKRYWKAIWESQDKTGYIKCWMKDLMKTFMLYWTLRLNIYRWMKSKIGGQ